MRNLLLLFSLLCGCTTSSDGTKSASLETTSPDSGSATVCPNTVASDCGSAGCTAWPADRGDWCGTHTGSLPSGTLTAGIGTCNGWSFVESLDGDQSTDFFYDASGALVAVARWGSSGTCDGACVYTCLAGPANLDLATLQSCVAGLTQGEVCE